MLFRALLSTSSRCFKLTEPEKVIVMEDGSKLQWAWESPERQQGAQAEAKFLWPGPWYANISLFPPPPLLRPAASRSSPIYSEWSLAPAVLFLRLNPKFLGEGDSGGCSTLGEVSAYCPSNRGLGEWRRAHGTKEAARSSSLQESGCGAGSRRCVGLGAFSTA